MERARSKGFVPVEGVDVDPARRRARDVGDSGVRDRVVGGAFLLVAVVEVEILQQPLFDLQISCLLSVIPRVSNVLASGSSVRGAPPASVVSEEYKDAFGAVDVGLLDGVEEEEGEGANGESNRFVVGGRRTSDGEDGWEVSSEKLLMDTRRLCLTHRKASAGAYDVSRDDEVVE